MNEINNCTNKNSPNSPYTNDEISNSSELTHKNKLLIKSNIRKLNPSFNYFNLDSFFIYESILYKEFYDKLIDKNNMKPNIQQ